LDAPCPDEIQLEHVLQAREDERSGKNDWMTATVTQLRNCAPFCQGTVFLTGIPVSFQCFQGTRFCGCYMLLQLKHGDTESTIWMRHAFVEAEASLAALAVKKDRVPADLRTLVDNSWTVEREMHTLEKISALH